jgi:hypothetical protein
MDRTTEEVFAEVKAAHSELKAVLLQMAVDVRAAKNDIELLHSALERIVDVPNYTASPSRAVSEIVKIATEAVESLRPVAH